MAIIEGEDSRETGHLSLIKEVFKKPDTTITSGITAKQKVSR